MRFYKDEQGNITCAPCTSIERDEGRDDDLEDLGITRVPEGIFKCASCDERFFVYDGRVFMEVT